MGRRADPKLRIRIIEQAEHLMHLHGYHRTSLDEIASSCKMTKANLFHHFRSKEDLGLAVLDFKIEAYNCNCVGPLGTNENPVAAVRQLFQDAECFFRDNGCKAGCFIGNIALEMSDINERFRERAQQFFTEWAKCLENSLRKQRAAGVFESTLRPKALAETILALYEGAIMLARTGRDPAVFDRIGKEACRLLEIHRSSKKSKMEVHHGT